MQYVSAAEGLHGSMRVNIWKNVDDDTNDTTTGGSANSLRLWVVGTADLGGDMSSTYYWEVRQGSGGVSGEALGTEAWDLGLTGSFGSFNFGKLGMVAPRLVPGGSLDNVIGNSNESFAADPGVNGIRYESPVINGFQAGISARVDDESETFIGKVGIETTNTTIIITDEDDVDEYSFAVKYSSPIGFQVGVGYEVEAYQGKDDVTSYTQIVTKNTGTNNDTFIALAETITKDDRKGWRAGARYGQDNWLLSYEYRSYENYAADHLKNLGNLALINNGTNVAAHIFKPISGYDFADGSEYKLHRMAVQVNIDRITASANYSIEAFDILADISELERKTLGIDAIYALGSRSMIGIGWQTKEAEQFATYTYTSDGTGAARPATFEGVIVNQLGKDVETTETLLYYRVDF